MSDERISPEQDRRVSDTYRELAAERTPDYLDARVMRAASGNGRTRYAIARGWTRPLAWAATIALSFAIVLELTQVTVPEPGSPEPQQATAATGSTAATDAPPGDFAPRDMESLRQAEDLARLQAGPNRTVDTTALESTSSTVPLATPLPQVGTATQTEPACPADIRKTAESWFDCIEDLRETGRHDQATREYEQFQKKFPDFPE